MNFSPQAYFDIMNIIDGKKIASELRTELKKHDIDLIKLVAPTTSNKRISEITKIAQNKYVVSSLKDNSLYFFN